MQPPPTHFLTSTTLQMCLIVAGTIFQVAAILQVVATDQLGLIYAGRAIGGFAVGIVTTVCPVYLAEVSPPAIRGRLVGFCAFFFFGLRKSNSLNMPL